MTEEQITKQATQIADHLFLRMSHNSGFDSVKTGIMRRFIDDYKNYLVERLSPPPPPQGDKP